MARDDEAVVTIARFETRFEASLARGALEAIGVRALVPGEFTRGEGPPWTHELQVFECDRDRAVVELRRMQIRVVELPERSA